MSESPHPYDIEPAASLGEAGRLAVNLVHGGFTDIDDAIEALVETFEDGEGGEDEEDGDEEDGDQHGEEDGEDEDARVGPQEAAALVRAVWRERLAAQHDWPQVTEAERLLAVLRELSDRNIVAEPNFTCCMGCGLAEIGALSTDRSRGFVFFHQQDTDRAVAGHGLTLTYGVFGGDPEGTAAIGREVAAALTGAGLPVEWNGSPAQRIRVTPLEWRIRLAALPA